MQLGAVISNCVYTCLCVCTILASFPGPNKASAILFENSIYFVRPFQRCVCCIFEGGDHSRVVYDQYDNPQLEIVCHPSMQRLAVWQHL